MLSCDTKVTRTGPGIEEAVIDVRGVENATERVELKKSLAADIELAREATNSSPWLSSKYLGLDGLLWLFSVSGVSIC